MRRTDADGAECKRMQVRAVGQRVVITDVMENRLLHDGYGQNENEAIVLPQLEMESGTLLSGTEFGEPEAGVAAVTPSLTTSSDKSRMPPRKPDLLSPTAYYSISR